MTEFYFGVNCPFKKVNSVNLSLTLTLKASCGILYYWLILISHVHQQKEVTFWLFFLISCTRPERGMKERKVFMWMCRCRQRFPSAEQYVLVLLTGHRGPYVCVKSPLRPRTQVAYHSSCERAPRVFCRLATKSIYSRQVLSSDSVFSPSWSFSDYAWKINTWQVRQVL